MHLDGDEERVADAVAHVYRRAAGGDTGSGECDAASAAHGDDGCVGTMREQAALAGVLRRQLRARADLEFSGRWGDAQPLEDERTNRPARAHHAPDVAARTYRHRPRAVAVGREVQTQRAVARVER